MPDAVKKKLSLIVGMDSKQAMTGMKRLQARVQKASKAISKWAKRAALGIAAIGIASIKLGMDFDTAMRNVWTLLKISREEFDSLKNQVLELSKIVPQTATDLATALYQLVSAQIPAAERMNVLEVAAKAATAGLSTTTQSAEALITVIKGYPKGTMSATKAADLLFKTIELGITTFPELSSSLSQLMPAVIVAGLGFEEVGAALATLTGQKVSTGESVTALNRMFFSLVTPTKQARKEIEKLVSAGNLRGLDLAKSKITDMSKLLKDLSKLGPEEMRTIVPREQGMKAMILLTKFRETYEANFEKMKDASGVMEEAFNKQMDSFQNKIKIIWSVIQVTANRIFEILETDVGRGLDYVRERFEALVTWIEANKEKLIKAVGNFAKTVGKVTEAVGKLAATIVTNKPIIIGFFSSLVLIKVASFTSAIVLLTTKVKLLGIFLIANPITAAILVGGAAVGVIGYEIHKRLETTRQRLDDIKDSIHEIPERKDFTFTLKAVGDTKVFSKLAAGGGFEPITGLGEGFGINVSPDMYPPTVLETMKMEGKELFSGRPTGFPEWEEYKRRHAGGRQYKPPGVSAPTPGAPLPLPPGFEEDWQREKEAGYARELSELQKKLQDEELERIRVKNMRYVDMSSVTKSAMIGMYEGMGRASERFFRGDLKNAEQWGASMEMIGRSVTTSMVRGVGDVLSAKAIEWTAEGFAALGTQLGWNPITAGAGAASYFKAAALAGVGEGVAYGAAGAISGAGEEHYASAFGEETMSREGGGTSGSGGRSRYGATTRATPETVIYSPSVTFEGENVFVGPTGMREVTETLEDQIVQVMKDARATGEFD